MLITVAQLEARYGTKDATAAHMHILDVSAEVVDYVNDSDITDSWTPTTTPAAVQGVVARVVNRALTNPMARTGEQLGDHNWQAPMGASGGTLGPKDRKIIRRATGQLGARQIDLEGYLPLEPAGLDDLSL